MKSEHKVERNRDIKSACTSSICFWVEQMERTVKAFAEERHIISVIKRSCLKSNMRKWSLYQRQWIQFFMYRKLVWDVASAWQSVWIVLNVDTNQDTVLDSCHPGSPQLWCQIPLRWSQKERDTLLGECASLNITQFSTDVLADALVKKCHNVIY